MDDIPRSAAYPGACAKVDCKALAGKRGQFRREPKDVALVKVDLALAELDAKVEPCGHARYRQGIQDVNGRIARTDDFWSDIYWFAEQPRVTEEKRCAIIKQRGALAHDVLHDSVYPCIVNCKVNIRLVGKRHTLFP